MVSVKGTKHLSDNEISAIKAYRDAGWRPTRIALVMKRDVSTICKFIKADKARVAEAGVVDRTEKRGRKRKTTASDDRMIVNAVKTDRFTTAKGIQSTVAAALGLSLNTIRGRIKESGEFNSYFAARKPFISGNNKIKRLAWAKEHLHWTSEQWRQVMWSDESPFVLRYNAKRRVWRMHNERYNQMCCVASVKHDVKIMVWGAFAAHGVGILHRIVGIMDRFIYLQLLEDVMEPSADILFGGENYIFQQDNDPKHTAIMVKEYIRERGIKTFAWPAQSPDLNPIENLWSILDQRTSERKVNSADELFALLKREWEALPMDLLERLVDSMPRRCQAVIDAKGWPTKY